MKVSGLMNVMERVILINQRCLLQSNHHFRKIYIHSEVQFFPISCFATVNSLCLCVYAHVICPVCVCSVFFQMACAVFPQYTGNFFLLLVEGPCVHSYYHATCKPLPLTFLCVVFLRSPLCPLSAVTVHR